MNRIDPHRRAGVSEGWRRREFLRTGSLGLLGLSQLESLAAAPAGVSVIWINLVGGPSQLDTFDPKPEAPSGVRGPFRAISTNVAGVRISEIFPRLARRADKYAILRTLHHDGSAVHDAGHQLMQTGRFFRNGERAPSLACALSHLQGCGAPVMLPAPIGATGGNMPHGQDAGCLGAACDPVTPTADGRGLVPWREGGAIAEPDSAFTPHPALDLGNEPEARVRYGGTRFGDSCLRAARLTAAGQRFVTVNMFETVFDQITWDIHGTAPFSPIEAYSEMVGPMFDQAFSALLDDLSHEGRLQRTLLVATGEFGRTPRINPVGGRDHWTGCWSMLMAGGGVRGGQVVGESDGWAAEPKERPIHPAEVAATVCRAAGVSPATTIRAEDGREMRLVDEGVEPIHELFA